MKALIYSSTNGRAGIDAPESQRRGPTQKAFITFLGKFHPNRLQVGIKCFLGVKQKLTQQKRKSQRCHSVENVRVAVRFFQRPNYATAVQTCRRNRV